MNVFFFQGQQGLDGERGKPGAQGLPVSRELVSHYFGSLNARNKSVTVIFNLLDITGCFRTNTNM